VPELTRRRFIGLATAGAVASPALLHAGPAGATRRRRRPDRARFAHGVASGDPLPEAVILWTRVSPPTPPPPSVVVEWTVARDRWLVDVVASGRVTTDAGRDWTVNVDATGLDEGTTYHYGFTALGGHSPVGRTRTAPSGHLHRARLAVMSCGDFSRGLFNAYARVAQRDDIDAVVHLGDYIYETARRDDRVRAHEPPGELRVLDDYRGRYASYRRDPALAELHRRHPVIWVWDDHETVDGTWREGADPENHDPAEDGDFGARKLAARQAALEWLPIRLPDRSDPERIYRRFAFGDLVDLLMLDTRRIGRDRQGAPNEGAFFRQVGEFADPSRHILGAAQEAWFIDSLSSSTAAWRLVGNQVVFAQLKVIGAPNATNASVYANPDQWDGYAPARDRIFDAIEAAAVEDLVFLTGDVHASIAFEVTRDPSEPTTYDPVTGRGAVAVELVTPSISSAGDPEPGQGGQPSVFDALRPANPHLKYGQTERNGYLLVDVTRRRLRAEFWLVPLVERPSEDEAIEQVFTVRRGAAHLVPKRSPRPPRPPVAPMTPGRAARTLLHG